MALDKAVSKLISMIDGTSSIELKAACALALGQAAKSGRA